MTVTLTVTDRTRWALAACLLLPLGALGCTEPTAEPPVIRLVSPGLDPGDAPDAVDDELWLLPGAEVLLAIESAAPDRATWTYAGAGAVELGGGGAGELASSVTVRAAAAVGDGTLTIRDAAGLDLLVLPVHVREPDRILVATAARWPATPVSGVLHVLEGEYLSLDVAYALGVHTLAGGGRLAADGDVAVFRGDATRGDGLAVQARAEPYVVNLTGGPGVGRGFTVRGVRPADAVLELTSAEATTAAGDYAAITHALRDRAGAKVEYVTAAWYRDGVATAARTAYEVAPGAPPSTVALVVGAPGRTVLATMTIHAPPWR